MTSSPLDTSRFVAHYAPDRAARAARRLWLAAALWLVVGAALTALAVAAFAPNVVAAIIISTVAAVGALSCAVGALSCAVGALRARSRWTADGGLAIEVSADGITLPLVGLITWDRIVGVRSSHTPGVEWQPGGKPRTTGYLDVFVADSFESLMKLPAPVRRRVVSGGPAMSSGFRTAEGAGIDAATFAQASDALLSAAQARGIPVAPWDATAAAAPSYSASPVVARDSDPSAQQAPVADAFYWATYAPQAARTYAIRGWVGVAIWLTLAVVFFISLGFTVTQNMTLAITVTAAMLLGAAMAAHAALRSRQNWATDGSLAIALSDRGVTLPGVGEIPWERISGVRSFDMGIATGNVFVFAFQAWHGIQAKAFLTIFVTDSLASLSQLPKPARRRLAPGGPDGAWGFVTAYRQGLGDTVWAEASSKLLEAAAQRGIPIVR
ncbi:hypothetical protein [Salinibacterium sp. ZJ77]|uniref:hypothetical protein n=1 Tax=Salinibacterium sp. ZJ77 TaxID=2708337 RepID=UPI00142280B1|nr:hypothetical protein [Salinibacterium sp. ZJ77]